MRVGVLVLLGTPPNPPASRGESEAEGFFRFLLKPSE